MRAWDDLLGALSLLSRLPLPAHQARGAAGAWAWPLAGVVLGAIAGGIGALTLGLGLAPGAAALLALLAAVMLGGALHEDGLADMADGLWGGQTPERRLEIMKDSRIGAFGVIALVLSLGARWAALSALFAASPWAGITAMVAAGTVSRAAMAGVMAALPPARENGLSRAVGRPGALGAGLAIALALLVLFGICGLSGISALIGAALAVALTARLALAKIGGQTGDVLGASQQMAEVAVLLVLMPG
ncbi:MULTISPECIES: adenosylcobinamide-GDP ribazoletransferase [Pseudooceanicola]|uniref:adenosylcobinamide-GDP ribazoletransferase n=1 Tax=Pseudooceanicola TaxID=1679449 RepID=UPI00288086E3|nr:MULTISPECIES: adenosylcobinamide-GDP ribazoletransferase [Pseudooceanicola]